jgi:hypothetical protein
MEARAIYYLHWCLYLKFPYHKEQKEVQKEHGRNWLT